MGKTGFLFALLLVGVCAGSLWAQSNTVVDSLLAEQAATSGEAAYMVMTAIAAVPDSATVEDAVAAVEAQFKDFKIENPAAPITLGKYSELLMRAFKMHGGIMYTILSGGRYAARELAFRNIITGDTSPYRTVSGAEVVQILGSVMSYEGAGS